MKVGMPVMKLNAGNIQSVIREAWLRDTEERRNCADPDYRPTLTADNTYLIGPSRATDIIREIDSRKQAYEETTGRKMRKDAVLSIGGIIKPNGEDFKKLSCERQMQFFRDSVEVLQGEDFFSGHITSCVVQVDEGVPHAHWTAIPIAQEGAWSAKKVLNLKMLKKLNALYPERMRARGWTVDSLAKFDEEQYRSMTAAEKAAYVEKKRQEKAAHGISSAQYKAKMEADKMRVAASKAARAEEEAATKRAEAAIAVAKEVTEQAARQAEEASAAAEAVQKAREELRNTRAALSDAKEELAAVRAATADARETYAKYAAVIPDDYEVVRAKAIDILLDWIPEDSAAFIRKSLNWILQWHRDRGRWPTRKPGAKRRWPGQSSDNDRQFERGR